MRQIIYKVLLKGASGKTLPITIATTEISHIPSLVERNKPIYIATMKDDVVGFEITDTMPTIQMTEEQYSNEVTFCDIVEEQVPLIFKRPDGAETYSLGKTRADNV